MQPWLRFNMERNRSGAIVIEVRVEQVMGVYDREVLVVGAGPAGLALACALRMHGVSVRVVDQASGPASTSRANILHARGVEVLDRLGALGDLPQRSQPALTITQYLDGQPAMTIRFGDLGLGAARPALYISQADIEAELRRRLTELGVDIDWGTALVDLAQDDHGVTATFAGGPTVRCGWLAGCDGAHSTVRKLTGIGFPACPSPNSSCWRTCTPTGRWIALEGMAGRTGTARCSQCRCARSAVPMTCGG